MKRTLNKLKFGSDLLRYNPKTGKFIRAAPWRGGRNSDFQIFHISHSDHYVAMAHKRIERLEKELLKTNAKINMLLSTLNSAIESEKERAIKLSMVNIESHKPLAENRIEKALNYKDDCKWTESDKVQFNDEEKALLAEFDKNGQTSHKVEDKKQWDVEVTIDYKWISFKKLTPPKDTIFWVKHKNGEIAKGQTDFVGHLRIQGSMGAWWKPYVNHPTHWSIRKDADKEIKPKMYPSEAANIYLNLSVDARKRLDKRFKPSGIMKSTTDHIFNNQSQPEILEYIKALKEEMEKQDKIAGETK